MFISGAAGLSFEVVWIHRCGLVFGSSVWSTSATLSSFMAGLALGSALAGALARSLGGLRAYAFLQVVVAVTGVVLTYALPELTPVLVPLIRPLAESSWSVNAIRFGAAFAAMVVPATAMGATLPVLIGGIARAGDRAFGSVLGRLYGWNTLGAVLGVVTAEVLLMPAVGVLGTAWSAAGADAIAAGLAVWLSRRTGGGTTRQIGAPSTPDAAWWNASRLLICAFLGGAALMALEVVWFRFLSMFVLNSTLAISMMLAVVLTAMGLGGLAAASWVDRDDRAPDHLPLVGTAAGCAVTASYLAFRSATQGSLVAAWHQVLWFSLVLAGTTAFFSGVLFTLIGTAIKRRTGEEARAAAWLTLANTIGGAFGPLAATFVLLPALGMERSLFAMTATYCLIGALLMPRPRADVRIRPLRTVAVAVAVAVAAVALVALSSGLMSRSYFPRAAEPYAADGSRIVATREGRGETIFLMEQSWLGQPIYWRLVTNGFSMSGTHLTGTRYMRAFAYWPMLLHQLPLRRALVLCYGVGVTTGAVTDLESVQSIDVVELSRDIVAMSDLIYASGQHPLHDRRIKLHVEDARQFLQASDERFDLITGEPPPPLTPGTVNLYTREYFRLMYERLAEGGISTYWLPVPRRGEYSVAPIIRAFCDVFADCSLWNGTPFDWMLVGTRNAPGPVTEQQFSKPWSDPREGPHLREIGYERPEQIGAAFLGDSAYLNELTRKTPALTDNYPRRLVSGLSQASGLAIIDEPGGSFQEILDPARARVAFEASPLVAHLWPQELIPRTGPYFAVQSIINRLMVDGADPLRDIAELNALLVQTDLRRLPLWAMGSNDALQRAADGANDGSGAVEYVLGERLLAARSFAAAATYFREAQGRGFHPVGVRPLEVYALCLAGNIQAARERAPAIASSDPEERVFWGWIQSKFGVGPRVSARSTLRAVEPPDGRE